MGRSVVAWIAGLAGVAGAWIALTAGAVAQEQEAAAPDPLAEMKVVYGKKEVRGDSLQDRLDPAVAQALGEWAGLAARMGWRVGVGQEGHWLLFGSVSRPAFDQGAAALEAAALLLARVAPPPSPDEDASTPAGLAIERTVICILLDEQGLKDAAWSALVDGLVEKGALDRSVAERVRSEPSGLTLRQSALFLQPSFDIAGNAAAGDDEFRLGNEVAHKYAQCVLRQRFGEQPELVRWGFGFLAEQRLFGTSYNFATAGFVASASHFGWAETAANELKEHAKDKDYRLSNYTSYEAQAGQAELPQVMTWAALDGLFADKGNALTALLGDLAALQRDADPHGLRPAWAAQPGPTADILARHIDALDCKDLQKRLRSQPKKK